MSRKYSTYRIHVVYKGGEEDIVLNDISSSSYKETLTTYNEIKETLQDKGAIKIEFQGITKDGEIGILFVKECELIEDTEDTKQLFLKRNLIYKIKIKIKIKISRTKINKIPRVLMKNFSPLMMKIINF